VSASYWQSVRAAGHAVPADRPLDELTAELTRMLGNRDPDTRSLAATTLAAWLERGVYDDLLAGLGDGMALGLQAGVGEHGTDSVLRRSWSALVLGRCLERDNARALVPGRQVLDWGDRLCTWLPRERDLREEVADRGLAGAIGHGATALAALAGSPHLETPELTVVLDVVADRVLAEADEAFGPEATDRLAAATMAVLRRDLVPLRVLEPWVARLAATAATRPAYPVASGASAHTAARNAEAFLRALYLQLSLGSPAPEVRSDLLLTVVDALRGSNRALLGATTG